LNYSVLSLLLFEVDAVLIFRLSEGNVDEDDPVDVAIIIESLRISVACMFEEVSSFFSVI